MLKGKNQRQMQVKDLLPRGRKSIIKKPSSDLGSMKCTMKT